MTDTDATPPPQVDAASSPLSEQFASELDLNEANTPTPPTPSIPTPPSPPTPPKEELFSEEDLGPTTSNKGKLKKKFIDEGIFRRRPEPVEIPDDGGSKEHKTCLKRAAKACVTPYVLFMLDHLRKMGCPVGVDEKNIVCEPCNPGMLGGFDPDAREVVACENTIANQRVMNTLLTHELIHAYDFCRVKYDQTNLRHLACTEIRAANLSGDCFWSQQFAQKFMWQVKFKKQQQRCVKDHAVKSIVLVKEISDAKAREIVDSVFEQCFHDTAPYERIPP